MYQKIKYKTKLKLKKNTHNKIKKRHKTTITIIQNLYKWLRFLNKKQKKKFCSILYLLNKKKNYISSKNYNIKKKLAKHSLEKKLTLKNNLTSTS